MDLSAVAGVGALTIHNEDDERMWRKIPKRRATYVFFTTTKLASSRRYGFDLEAHSGLQPKQAFARG